LEAQIMTVMTVRSLRILDAFLARAWRRESQPRSIDRYIDYFGEGLARSQGGAPAK
jgi:hypothetical protein